MMKLSPKAYNVTIQLQYDELMCYMFANKLVLFQVMCMTLLTHFVLGTTAVRYSLLLIVNS